MEFTNKKVLVIGLGRSGLSAARWLIGEAASVTICDIKPEPDLDRELVEEARKLQIELETGEHNKETFLTSDLIT